MKSIKSSRFWEIEENIKSHSCSFYIKEEEEKEEEEEQEEEEEEQEQQQMNRVRK